MDSTFVSVFDDDLLSRPYCPTEVPIWDMVCQLEALYFFKLCTYTQILIMPKSELRRNPNAYKFCFKTYIFGRFKMSPQIAENRTLENKT